MSLNAMSTDLAELATMTFYALRFPLQQFLVGLS
ncbi:hypothetical protein ABH939_002123 [Rhodococcus sp. 27YEA6]|jgi:hypothetical protein|nr:hypothetical protein BKP42_38430 [Rhodococcus erythropolis]